MEPPARQPTHGTGPRGACSETIGRPLLVVGGGNMGSAIVAGAVRAGVLAGSRVVVVDPSPEKHAAFRALGAACEAAIPAGLAQLAALEAEPGTGGDGVVLLAVKPQMLGDVAAAFGDALRTTPRAVLSILAGVTTARLAAELGGRPVRLMPNTPSQIGRGITALCVEPGPPRAGGPAAAPPTASDLALTRTLFHAVGRVVELPEHLLDAFTGVAGSGPAYVFLLAEGMLAGAEAVGFSRAQGLELVRATISGAAGLLDAAAADADPATADPATADPADPAALRAMVTSKGGTTAAATAVLLERGMPDALCAAIVAARDRAGGLSQPGRDAAEGSRRGAETQREGGR